MKKIFIFSFIFVAFTACSNDKKTAPATIDTTSNSMAADAMKNDAKAVPTDSVSRAVNPDTPKITGQPDAPKP